MGVGWIDNIYNNSGSNWYFKSDDDRNNGELAAGGTKFTLDDKSWHPLSNNTHYAASWCGIPWYYQGKHYKAISKDRNNGVKFYTSEIGGKNWIIYEDLTTGRQIVRQSAPKGSDFHCKLMLEDGTAYINIVNNHEFSAENAVFQVLSEANSWAKVLVTSASEIIGAAVSPT